MGWDNSHHKLLILMVDLKSSCLNLLRDLVRQLMPLYDAIRNPTNNIEEHAENHLSVLPNEDAEILSAGARPQDALSRSLCLNAGDSADLSNATRNLQSPMAAEDSNLGDSARPDGTHWVSAALLAQYDRQALFEKVWQANLRTVAAEIGIHRKTLCRVCRELHIPIPPHGFWMKKPEDRPAVPRPPLPEVQVAGGGTIKGEVPGDALKVSALLLSRYDREELYRRAWQKPMRELAKEYGVAKDVIGLHCRQLHIPIPGARYWQRRPGWRRRTGRLCRRLWPWALQIMRRERNFSEVVESSDRTSQRPRGKRANIECIPAKVCKDVPPLIETYN
jgi:hypothetical protein